MIIECKCQKYKFQIPGDTIINDGRLLKCGFCDEEWIHNELTTNTDLPLPGKNQKLKVNIKPKKNPFAFIFMFVLTILFVGIVFNRDLILDKYPPFLGFFESADILKEIIIQNANWIKEIILNLFKK